VGQIKGIILAGGLGTRLRPATSVIVKQLLPVYDKPMIYYPLSTLMSAQIKDIAIICNPNDLQYFQKLFGSGKSLGIDIIYLVQEKPRGIAEAFLIAEKFLNSEPCALILGDNLFHGPGLGRQLAKFHGIEGSQIFGYHVQDPRSYGVIEISSDGFPVSIEEKPKTPKSSFAIPGLYFFDGNVSAYAAQVEFSNRGELEITEILQKYLDLGKLKVEVISRGSAWLDTGTFDSLLAASNYVQVIEQRQGYKVGCPEEISLLNGWINEKDIEKIINDLGDNSYTEYLRSLTYNSAHGL
jgi:glucose-1-phosphate thymidylyltransferase